MTLFSEEPAVESSIAWSVVADLQTSKGLVADLEATGDHTGLAVVAANVELLTLVQITKEIIFLA